jgi:hypothetical protein
VRSSFLSQNFWILRGIKSTPQFTNQRAFIERLIEWIAVKLISFPSVTHPLFQEIAQRADPDYSEPVSNTLKHYITCLAEVYPQLPERQEKSHCSLMADGAKVRLTLSGGCSVHGRTRSIRGLEDSQ